MTMTIRRYIALQQMRWRQKLLDRCSFLHYEMRGRQVPAGWESSNATVSEYKLTFSNWHTSGGAES